MAESEKRNVLIAEDSSAVQDLLKLILISRGHTITIAEDGMQALNNLMENTYDIVLMDFRLPMLNGLEVGQKYLLEIEESEPIPRFICMTGNVDGFLREPNATDIFERVLGKPLDIDAIVPLIEEPDSILKPRPRRESEDKGDFSNGVRYFQHLDGEFLHYPQDFHGDPESREIEARLALRGAPDAMIITQPVEPEKAELLARVTLSQATPVIDLTGLMTFGVDLSGKQVAVNDSQVVATVESFAERRGKISRDVLQSRDEEIQLLTRVFSVGGELKVAHDGTSKHGVRYNTLFSPERVCIIAERLSEKGLLSHEYFDRSLYCPNCRSGRLSAREECCTCSSTNLTKTQYVHHFRCATLAPEPAFVVDDDLVCPKCHRQLKQMGEDYDKPGDVLVCNQCSATNSEADVAFVCLDCHARTDGEAIQTRDVYSYTITDKGTDLVLNGLDDKARTSRKLILSNLPMDLMADINKAAGKYLEKDEPFNLACITFRNGRQLEWRTGHAAVSNAMQEICEEVARSLGDRVGNWALEAETASFLMFSGSVEEDQRILMEKVEAANKLNPLEFEIRCSCLSPEDLF